MISDAYKAVLRSTRETAAGWGGARRHAWPVLEELQKRRIDSGAVLDYGAGLGRFGEELERIAPGRYRVANYEPSIPAFDVLPAGLFDCVVCTHVLEHVEPDLLEATLEELKERVLRFAYIEVPHGPAGLTLADGRNAHLIQQPWDWWHCRFAETFPNSDITLCVAKNPLNTLFVVDL